MRHTSGTWLAFAGAHPNVIKDVLRHSDIRLTMDRYGHLFDGESHKAVESLPNLSEAVQHATGTDGEPAEPLGRALGGITGESVPSVRVGAQIDGPAVNAGEASRTALERPKSPFKLRIGEAGIRTRGRGLPPTTV